MYNSVVSSIVTVLCNHHHLISSMFITPKRSPSLSSYSPFFPNPNPYFLSLCIWLFWSFHVHGYLCLASFIYHNVFWVYSLCSVYQYFIPFWGWPILYFYGYTTFCLSVYHLMDICIVSIFFGWIIPLLTVIYRFWRKILQWLTSFTFPSAINENFISPPPDIFYLDS